MQGTAYVILRDVQNKDSKRNDLFVYCSQHHALVPGFGLVGAFARQDSPFAQLSEFPDHSSLLIINHKLHLQFGAAIHSATFSSAAGESKVDSSPDIVLLDMLGNFSL